MARELLPVARAYQARDRRFAHACAFPAAEAAQDAAHDALGNLAEAVLAVPSCSPAALALKARAVKTWGKPEWWDPIEGCADTYERLAARMLDRIMGMAEADDK